MRNGIYIKSAAQISVQEPLCDRWMTFPSELQGSIAMSHDPDFKAFVSPIQGRRMGHLMKRALAVTKTALADAGIENPDAIVFGTGLGCLEHTEAFMKGITGADGAVMKPTHFMQSTHNTLASLIAIMTGSHGYNATYSQNGVSFESALDDASVQMKLGRIGNALVGAFDEITPVWAGLMAKAGFAGTGTSVPASEAAVSFVLGNGPEGALCRLAGLRMVYRPVDFDNIIESLLADNGLEASDISAVVTGIDGNPVNDSVYVTMLSGLCSGMPVLRYRHLFGESFSASALGMYVGVKCISEGFIPHSLYIAGGNGVLPEPRNILVLNHFRGSSFSAILLSLV